MTFYYIISDYGSHKFEFVKRKSKYFNNNEKKIYITVHNTV